MSERLIETIGKLIKKEILRSVEHETHSGKLTFENLEPYPGYHGTTVPDSLEPDSLFAITKMKYNDERIIRAIQAVKKKTDLDFDAAPGSVKYMNETYNCIRFRGLKYQSLGDLLRLFDQTGLNFHRKRKVRSFETLIDIRKFFRLKETIDGIYEDLEQENTSYIELPIQLTWNQFEKITMSIKYNMEDRNFDAAQSSVYTEKGLMDFVRIYDQESCQGKLIHIKEKYLAAVEKIY
jgi:hypothetical protein